MINERVISFKKTTVGHEDFIIRCFYLLFNWDMIWLHVKRVLEGQTILVEQY